MVRDYKKIALTGRFNFAMVRVKDVFIRHKAAIFTRGIERIQLSLRVLN